MPVEDPEELIVTCDECGTDQHFTATLERHNRRDLYGVSDKTLEAEGWSVDANGKILCDACLDPEEEEEDEEEEECEECMGTGQVAGDEGEDDDECPECGGSGIA